MNAILSAEPKAAAVPAAVWVRFPNTYEINTWIWLSELSGKHRKRVDLSTVPATAPLES
jgi:hypothetical protein